MNQYQIAIIGLLLMQAVTLCILWRTQQDGEAWRKAWLRDAEELLALKQGRD